MLRRASGPGTADGRVQGAHEPGHRPDDPCRAVVRGPGSSNGPAGVARTGGYAVNQVLVGSTETRWPVAGRGTFGGRRTATAAGLEDPTDPIRSGLRRTSRGSGSAPPRRRTSRTRVATPWNMPLSGAITARRGPAHQAGRLVEFL
ncbi:hypothetical protein GCM10010345_81630 [Streptomyces canarius]|uniref:Aldehyde dehydrogenase domain-containing protein n=1 Tax=Streptomyces canarius TaxID=285453 RepID=A0ABQ3D8B3_9ACTN|nr:hypothetical protein GCM10010345_81630 [Streptomyces canarius]